MVKAKTKKTESEVWPKVTVGSHLTVTTYEDGRTELKWDDEALMRDVQEAIAKVTPKELKPAVKAKAVVAKKKTAKKVKDGK